MVVIRCLVDDTMTAEARGGRAIAHFSPARTSRPPTTRILRTEQYVLKFGSGNLREIAT
jgi:hypothetical protein